MSAAKAAISSVSMARAARGAGIRAEAFKGVSRKLCRIKARSLALARKNMSLISAASFGCIDRFDDDRRNCAALGGSTGGAAEGGGISRARGAFPSGLERRSPNLFRTSTGVPG